MDDDDTPIEELIVELEVRMCDRFPAMSPLSMRKERANDVFRMVAQYSEFARKENNKKNGKQIIRRRAGDDWF